MNFLKRFRDWILLKEKLNDHQFKPPLFKQGEIWWCSIEENIGTESSGKGDYFRRPVLIIKKLDRYSFIGVPITSKNKAGTWYTEIIQGGIKNTAIIAQIRHFDYHRMDKKISTLDEQEFLLVHKSLLNLLSEK